MRNVKMHSILKVFVVVFEPGSIIERTLIVCTISVCTLNSYIKVFIDGFQKRVRAPSQVRNVPFSIYNYVVEAHVMFVSSHKF